MKKLIARIQKKLRVSELEAEGIARVLINCVVFSFIVSLVAIFYFCNIFIEVDGNLTSKFEIRLLGLHWFDFSTILSFSFIVFWSQGEKRIKTRCVDRKSRLPLERRRHLFLPAVFFIMKPEKPD